MNDLSSPQIFRFMMSMKDRHVRHVLVSDTCLPIVSATTPVHISTVTRYFLTLLVVLATPVHISTVTHYFLKLLVVLALRFMFHNMIVTLDACCYLSNSVVYALLVLLF